MEEKRQWLSSAVFYQIYPQSFMDSNGDGIGDLEGIIEKLPYLAELGISAVWINPCFRSPFRDAGYDVEDFYSIADRYGTNEDMKRLLQKAHELGIRVLLDLVAGHTASTHPWFIQSEKAEKGPYTDRYIWTDSIWKHPGGDWGSYRGMSDRDGSCMVNFFTHQPALNYGFYEIKESWQQPMDAPGPMATREELKRICRFWLSMGVDGFRVDMAHSLVKGDPEQKGTMLLWEDMRRFLEKEFPEAVLVSEWGNPERSLEAGFHMDFLLHFGESHYNDLFRYCEPYFNGKGTAKEFVKTYEHFKEKNKKGGKICIPSGNHDMERLARWITTEQRRKLAFGFLLTMPGVPYIYYGDEIGMRYRENLTSKEGGYDRTGSRTPMQWSEGVNAGFSTAAPDRLYLPVDESKDRPSVEKQQKDEKSLYHEVKRLIALRKAHEALQADAEISFLSDDPLTYIRRGTTESLLVAINPRKEEKAVVIPEGLSLGKKALYQIREKAEKKPEQKENLLYIPGESLWIYELG